MKASFSIPGILWRLLIPVLITGLGTVCFQSGVEASAIPGLHNAGFFMHLYYSISLFTFGGTALGFPLGGPEWANVLLRVLFFLAPAVSLAAIGEALFRSVNPTLSYCIWRGNYRIVIGYGWAGRLLTEEIRRLYPGDTIIVVDRAHATRSRMLGGILFVGEDALQKETMEFLRPARSKGVFCITGDEVINLKVFFTWQKCMEADPAFSAKRPPFLVRVSSEDLIPELRLRYPSSELTFFNIHIEAIGQLFELRYPNAHLVRAQQWLERLRASRPRNWVFLGFGRYGQALLRQLSADPGFAGAMERLTLVGPDVENEWLHFKLESENPAAIPAPSLQVFRQEEMRSIEHIVLGCRSGSPTVVVFASNHEVENLKVASLLSRSLGKRQNADVCFIIRTLQANPVLENLMTSHEEARRLILPTQDYLKAFFEDVLLHGHITTPDT